MTITTTKPGVWVLDDSYKKVVSGYWSYGTTADVGTLWSWGYNGQGQLGINDTFDRCSPNQIPGCWLRISTADGSSFTHTLATKSNGTLWAWGFGNFGNLANPSTTAQQSSPVQIPGTTWTIISASYQTSHALKTDGTLWGWGINFSGQIGNNTKGTFSNQGCSSPVQIPGTTWCNVSGDGRFVLAQKTDSTLWAWGGNSYGTLGNNTTTTDFSSPVQIPGTNWSKIDGGVVNSLALKTDGTLWAWGRNERGQLGDNTTTYRSSPVQIPGTAWNDVTVGYQSSFARKTDGTLWAWGSDVWGSLGIGTTNVFKSSPTQIPGTSWSAVCSGRISTHALKTNGTLWGWGQNYCGQVGDGSNWPSLRSSPVQIPGTSWSDISDGGFSSFAKKSL